MLLIKTLPSAAGPTGGSGKQGQTLPSSYLLPSPFPPPRRCCPAGSLGVLMLHMVCVGGVLAGVSASLGG